MLHITLRTSCRRLPKHVQFVLPRYVTKMFLLHSPKCDPLYSELNKCLSLISLKAHDVGKPLKLEPKVARRSPVYVKITNDR